MIPPVTHIVGHLGARLRERGGDEHIKHYEPETDILLTNAIYRLVTPRDLPHMTPGAPLGHGQVMLGVHRLF